jgi:DNA-binding transcriptional regulator YbjK
MLAPTRRDKLAATAVAVLADHGSRGLTHRAVDRAAGVAEGTTSFYFRTRSALLGAVVQHLASTDAAAVTTLAGTSIDDLLDTLAAAVTGEDGTPPPTQVARLQLTLESQRHPELHEALVASGEAVRAALVTSLEAAGVAGAEKSATALLVTVDGLLVDRAAGRRVATLQDVRDLLRRTLDAT